MVAFYFGDRGIAIGGTAMLDLPSFVVRGERARLFPVLADTSKEGRTLSILLACIENVDEFGRALLAELNQRAGPRARIETYTEVVLKDASGGQSFRPDGLIVLTVGSKQWTALVEAKVGNADLTVEQVENYLDVAKMNGVDALITISNQFAPLPSQHPLTVSAISRRKADLFHWSWMSILTVADLLISNEIVEDGDQRVILNEMVRFLSHPSAGVKGYEQMPACWTDIVASIQAGGTISQSAPEAHELMEAWYQEARDLSLILSRQVGREVRIRVPRAHEADANLRRKADLQTLAEDKSCYPRQKGTPRGGSRPPPFFCRADCGLLRPIGRRTRGSPNCCPEGKGRAALPSAFCFATSRWSTKQTATARRIRRQLMPELVGLPNRAQLRGSSLRGPDAPLNLEPVTPPTASSASV